MSCIGRPCGPTAPPAPMRMPATRYTHTVTEPLRSVLAEGDADAIEEYANEKMNYRIEHQA